MKRKTKNMILSITAVGLACSLATGTLLRSSVSVAASAAMMPGIESIVDSTTTEEPFRILEITDNKSNAEIGYYISGQEPFLKLYDYNGRTFATVEEALAVLPEEERRELMRNRNLNFCGEDSESYPLNYEEYEECYFAQGDENSWKRVDFREQKPRIVELNGHYEEVAPGTGDYLKGEMEYYPVRQGTSDAEKAEYIQNIQGFLYKGNGAAVPYLVNFQPVLGADGNAVRALSSEQIEAAYDHTHGGCGYYVNIYRRLNKNTDFSTFPGEKNPVESPEIEALEAQKAFDDGGTFTGFSDFGTGEVFGDHAIADASVDAAFAINDENPMTYREEVIKEYPNLRYKEYLQWNTIIETAKPYSDEEIQAMGQELITYDENGDYSLWIRNEFGEIQKEMLYYVMGREYVTKNNVRPLPDDYYGNMAFGDTEAETKVVPYYYEVSDTDFACIFDETKEEGATPEEADLYPEAYCYTGWYDAFSPGDEMPFLKTESNATYYTLEDQYVLKPGQGNYIFVSDEMDEKAEVQVDHLFYKGGYDNHDWMKRYVFHLSPEEEDFDEFKIDVTSLNAEEFTETYAGGEIAEAAFSDTDDSFQDDDPFLDQESLPDDVSPVEMMISDGQDLGEIGELSADYAELESEYKEEPFLDEEDLQAVIEEVQKDVIDEEVFTSEADVVYAAGESVLEIPGLNDFDLIYLNGFLTSPSAKLLAESGIPCIINQSKANDVITAEFSGFLKEDTDGHYVNQYVYFFKNTLDTDEGNSLTLVNCFFRRNFYIDEGEFAETNPMEGFEEILDYIESENKYRELGKSESSGITDGEAPEKMELLSKEISQARAIEYILNFRYKRVILSKDKIQVLEIQPAKSSGEIDETEILRWMGYDPLESNVTACCEQTAGEDGRISNMTDGREETYWHSQYNPGGHTGTKNHEIIILNNRPAIFRGFTYVPRSITHANGEIRKCLVACYDKNGNLLGDKVEVDWSNNNEKRKVYCPETLIYDVSKVTVEITESYANGNPSNKYGSCGEFLVDMEEPEAAAYPEVDITSMTSSEFAGHIDDINVKYDMIYWGADDTRLDDYANFRPDSYLYYHIGRPVQALYELQGLMYQDYADYQGGNLDAKEMGGNIGLVRGSGNDITAQQRDSLIEFVKSGYPVILGDRLVEGQEIDMAKVDNSSYVCQFLKKILGYPNVMTRAEVSEKQNLQFYMNIPKPVIDLKEFPPDAIGNENGPSMVFLEGDGLFYRFIIRNDAENTPAAAGYNCELYLDLNSDGNYSPVSERMGDIEVRDEAGNVIYRKADGKYNLRIGKEYSLRRAVPEGYSKLIAWKLEISNNQNEYIRTSVNGYTKRARQGDTIPEIKVLQIKPVNNCTWDLASSDRFYKLCQVVDDEFLIQVQSITISDYNQNYNVETGSLGSLFKENYNNLSDYDMLIIGFGDGFYAYGAEPEKNISMNGIKGIQGFIDSGKSVIFAHDTTSSSVVDPKTSDYTTNGSKGKFWKGWAYNVNTQLRAAMGMDRYGIIGNEKNAGNEISDILRNAKSLNMNDQNIWSLVQSNVPDMAYKPGAGQTEACPETHGFSNAKLRIATEGRGNHTDKDDVGRVTSVNEGAITEYPYKIPDEGGFSVATTHAQYYQAALEADTDNDKRNDVVVWYCLTDKSYADSPNDVRNNYYIYSNKNVYYTGVGHSGVDFAGNETEMKLFVNTIVAAYRASAINPKIEFVSDFDIDAQEQEIVYYMTDQTSFDQGGGNLLNESQDFYFRVRDDNLISTAAGERDMEVEFFITPPEGAEAVPTVNGIAEQVVPLEEIEIYRIDGNQTSTVSSGNVYRFRLDDMYQYLMNDRNYRNDVRIYVKTTTKYNYFGKEIDAFAVDSLSFRQRQLFDLD